MRTIAPTGRRAALALAVAGSLGFGGAQALADAGAEAGTHCEDRICTFQCGAAGGHEVYRGICVCCLSNAS